MEQRHHHSLRVLALVCVAAAMLSGLPGYAPRPSMPDSAATGEVTVSLQTPTPTTAADTSTPQPSPTPAAPALAPGESTPGGYADVLPVSGFVAPKGMAVVEPFALLAAIHAVKAPGYAGLKSLELRLMSRGAPLEQVSGADANLAADAARRGAVVTLINQSGVEICYVYFSPSDGDTWGDDWLGNDTLPPGENRDIELPDGTYDVKAETCDGEVIEEHRNVEISGEMNWTIEGGENRDDQPQEPGDEEETQEERVQQQEREPVDAELNQFLCCGQTAGETRIWGISYPAGWQVQLIPDDPDHFLAALFSDPNSHMQVHMAPSAWTPMGTPMDTGDVDEYLTALTENRQGQHPGFKEVTREAMPGIPNGRIWSGTWEEDGQQFWESFTVIVWGGTYVEGMPRGGLSLMGLHAAATEWATARSIYEQMLGTMQVQVIRTGQAYTPPESGPSDDPEETGMGDEGRAATSSWELLFCPKACEWEKVDIANQPAGQQWCCSDGCVGQLSQVPCTADQCNASCAY
jgi:hypothetical protein